MNRRLVSVFAFALLVATLTSFLVYRLILLRLQAPGHAALPATKLVVAAHDLQVGLLIHDYDLAEAPWSGPLPDHAAKTRQEAIGRGVIATIYQNEPILDHRLASKGAGGGLAATIPVGMRAVALRVNDVVGLAGFVLPGMRVDVLVAGTPGGNQSATGTLCRTVLQNIEVLSSGTKIERNVEGKPETAQVVNLLVTPDQAEILNLASSETKVQLVLRNPLDTHEQTTHGTSVAGLFGQSIRPTPEPIMFRLPSPQPVIVPPVTHEPGMTTVEVFSGTKRSEQVFETRQEKNQ
jgi:pilus assembly protein CpaB